MIKFDAAFDAYNTANNLYTLALLFYNAKKWIAYISCKIIERNSLLSRPNAMATASVYQI